MTTDKKLCIDCKYFKESDDRILGLWRRCYHPENLDYVANQPINPPDFLREAFSTKCGERGLWFEQKPPEPPEPPKKPGFWAKLFGELSEY